MVRVTPTQVDKTRWGVDLIDLEAGHTSGATNHIILNRNASVKRLSNFRPLYQKIMRPYVG